MGMPAISVSPLVSKKLGERMQVSPGVFLRKALLYKE